MAGFLTGFVTGAANAATQITQDNTRRRDAVIERSMVAFRANMEQRQERDRRLNQQLAQAQILGHRVGGAQNAEAILRADLGPQLIAGQISMSGQPNAAPTPAPITGQGGLMAPANVSPVAPSAPGLGNPTGNPLAPAGGSTIAPQMPDPRAAVSAQPTAPQGTPEAPQENGIMGGIRRAMFGRDPFEGVQQEVRNRYMQESGMPRAEMDRLMAPDRPIPTIQGQVNMAPLPPEAMARISDRFRDAAGMQRFMDTNGRDASGLINFGDHAALQREIAQMRVAASQTRAARPININPSYFNAAERSLAGLLPSGMIRTSQGPDGQTTFTIAIPSNDPRYANAQRMLATAREALGPALRGEVEGVHIGDTSAAAAYAARVAGFLGNPQQTQRQPQGNPATVAPRDVGNAAPAATVGSRVNPHRNVTPEQINALPPGAYYVGPDGQTRQRRNQ